MPNIYKWLDGRVVMQRPAKPFTPVRFRLQPPILIGVYTRPKYNMRFEGEKL